MGCQKAIAKKIVDAGADYVLAVKDNQPHLLDDIQESINKALDNGREGVEYETYETEENSHGRKETRRYLVVTDLDGIRNQEDWAGLSVIGMYWSTRSDEARYFIGSRKTGASVYGDAIRDHWSIENNLHWQLDITFHEDANRVQKRHGAANLALVRRLALSLLKGHPGARSMACKRFAAALNTQILEEILSPASKLGNR